MKIYGAPLVLFKKMGFAQKTREGVLCNLKGGRFSFGKTNKKI